MSEEDNIPEFEMFNFSNDERFRNLFPKDVVSNIVKYYEYRDFYHNVYKKYKYEAIPLLKSLARKQIYDFKTVQNHPDVQQFLNDICATNCFTLMFSLEKLFREFKEGINVTDKYPKLERWREFYSKPNEPPVLSDDNRKYHIDFNDEEWKKYKEEEDRKMRIYHNREEKRKAEYFDIVQPLIFKYMPDLYNIDDDYWIIYAVIIRDVYEEWRALCDEIETIIDYQMPPESVKLESDDFMKLVHEYFKLRGRKISDDHLTRIYSEGENL